MNIDKKVLGKHFLTGFCPIKFEDDLNGMFDPSEGYAIELDCGVLLAVYDPSDGYRSVAWSGLASEESLKKIQITNHFPPQKVYIDIARYPRHGSPEDVEEEFDEFLEIFDFDDNESLILRVGTEYYYGDPYYPLGIINWYPENLPINKNKISEK